MLNGDRVSGGEDELFLEVDGGDVTHQCNCT